MTVKDILALDAIDRAERRLREIGTDPSLTTEGKWRRLLEEIVDDAFVEFQDLIGQDLPFDAYFEREEENVDQPLGPGGGPVWWPVLIYNKQPHSFWQGKYPFGDTPEKSKKRKKKAWTSKPPMYTDGGPQDRPSPAKLAASPKRESLSVEDIRREDAEVEELLLLGVL